jgi:hypothetical protein
VNHRGQKCPFLQRISLRKWLYPILFIFVWKFLVFHACIYEWVASFLVCPRFIESRYLWKPIMKTTDTKGTIITISLNCSLSWVLIIGNPIANGTHSNVTWNSRLNYCVCVDEFINVPITASWYSGLSFRIRN